MGKKEEKDGGIYWNPNAYEWVGYGQAIKSSGGGDPMKLFGGQQSALPAGASATPISSAPVTAQMPQTPVAPVTAQMSSMAIPQAPQPTAMPTPAYDFVANAGMPATAQMPQAPVAPQPVQGQPFNNIINDRILY